MFLLPADQQFVDNLLKNYNIDEEELLSNLDDYGIKFSDRATLCNTVISLIFEQIIYNVTTSADLDCLSDKQIETVREGLIDGIYTNCIDSGIQVEKAIEYIQGLKLARYKKLQAVTALEDLTSTLQ